MFVDYTEIHVAAGTGGSGAEAFRREMGVAFGGPSGGDGGRGGHVILRADAQLWTLLDFRYQQHYRAERGQHGQGKNRTGKDGADLVLRVPVGTVVRDAETGDVLGELTLEGEEMVVARGGRGGRGNARFATPTRQAPRYWEPGAEGEERRIALELKLIADVGLVGQPNAGKSTFLAAVSAATPKIADYPFTTLTPNLGVVALSNARTFVVADIPGIIEGAHEGRGLGHRFLRHIERTRTLAYLIGVDAEDPQAEYEVLRNELRRYSEELAAKPHCVLLTKRDLLPPDAEPISIDAPGAWARFTISAVARQGLDEVLEAMWARVRETIAEETAEEDLEPYRP
jgi:GTPase